MAPIRVGIIGLAAERNTEGYKSGQWGVQHLNALVESPHYQIVAVCNSTVESAAKAVETHQLGPDVKAFGSAEEMSASSDLDLVVISIHVDKHFYVTKSALAHGKDIYLEFPVASNIAHVEELAKLAKEAGVKTIIGSQAVGDPALRKVKSLIKSKVIGDVVLSSFVGHIAMFTADGWPDTHKKFLDLDSGISRINIALGHPLAAYIDTLGELDTVRSIYKIQDKTARIFDDSNHTIHPAYKVSAPDTILFQGIHTSGAVSSFSLRTCRSPVEDVGFRWLISGTKGEIELTTGPGFIQTGHLNEKISIRKWGAETETVAFGEGEEAHIASTVQPARNIARAYEAFAKGDKEGYTTIDKALKIHRLLDRITESAQWAP